MLKNSLTIPVLYWEWFGYHEWVEVNQFVNEFAPEFEKVKDRILKSKEKYSNIKDVPFKQLNPYEIATYILSVLGNEKSYLLGAKHIILKKGALKDLRKTLDNMNNLVKMSNPPQKLPNKRGTLVISGNQSGKRSNSKTSKQNSKKPSINHTRQGSNNNLTEFKRSESLKKNENSLDANLTNSQNLKKMTTLNSQINENNKINENNDVKDRRNSMKIQCHLNIVTNFKNLMGSTSQNNNINNWVNQNTQNEIKMSSNYDLFKLLNPKATSSNSSLNNSIENKPNDNEKMLEQFKKDNNIIIPKKHYFNAIKNLFDYSKIEDFGIFDYNDFIPEIIRLQSAWHAFRARKKYKIYRYVIKQICTIQRTTRGMITRKKFRKFVYCHNCILFIQRVYKSRHIMRTNAITKIQLLWKSYKSTNRLKAKIAKRRRSEMGDYVSDSSSEEGSINNQLGKQTTKKRKSLKKEFEAELLNVSVKTDRKRTIQRNETNNYNNLSSNIISLADLQNETDKNKIVEYLLLDQAIKLGNENNALNRSLLDKTGVSKNLRQCIKQVKQVDRKKRQGGKRVSSFFIIINNNM